VAYIHQQQRLSLYQCPCTTHIHIFIYLLGGSVSRAPPSQPNTNHRLAKTAKPLVPSFRSLGAKLRPNRCPPYPLLKTEDNASCEPPLCRGAIAQHTHIVPDPARTTTTPSPTNNHNTTTAMSWKGFQKGATRVRYHDLLPTQTRIPG
jgi:hypothetical protein